MFGVAWLLVKNVSNILVTMSLPFNLNVPTNHSTCPLDCGWNSGVYMCLIHAGVLIKNKL